MGEKDRAAALARLGFSYGIGMVIGPTIGGLVTTNFGEYAAAFLAAAGSSVSLVLVILYVPNIPKQVEPDTNQSVLNIKKIFSLLLLPKAGALLLVKTVCGVPIGIMQSMFSLIAMEQFKLPADQNGMLLSYIGGLSMFMQGIGISAFTSRFSDLALLKFSSVSLVVCYYLLSLLSSLQDFMLLQVPMVCSLPNQLHTSILPDQSRSLKPDWHHAGSEHGSPLHYQDSCSHYRWSYDGQPWLPQHWISRHGLQ